MAHSIVKVNTPSPYLVLSKDDKLPEVLTMSESNSHSLKSVETDIKVFTAQKCHSTACVTQFTTGLNTVEIPAEQLNWNDQCNYIKVGSLTECSVHFLNHKLKQLKDKRLTMVISGDSLNKTVFKLSKDCIIPSAELLVISDKMALDIIGDNLKITNAKSLFEIATAVSNECGARNIFITSSVEDNVIGILSDAVAQSFMVFKGHRSLNGMESPFSTAVIANLSHGYSLHESVYGALEYTQNILMVTTDGIPNFMYAIDIPLKKMVEDDCFSAHHLITIEKPIVDHEISKDFFSYLIDHPLVKPYWESYTNHEFVRQIANNTLDLKKFQFFIEQDYSYLVDYGRVHCIAASKAPDLNDMEQEIVIVGRIREEMRQHEKRLKEEFGVTDDEYFTNIKRGPALKNYSRYFNEVAKKGNWQELVAALTPCLMGYGHAALPYKENTTAPEGGLYNEWIKIYSCESYNDGMKIGSQLLNHIARSYPADKLETLVKIYGEVCDLETKFWDAALEYKG